MGVGRQEIYVPLPMCGDRLNLRVLELRDAAVISELVSDPDVIKQTASMTAPYRQSEAEDWIRQELGALDGKRQVLVIEERQSGVLVGTVSVQIKRRLLGRVGTIGYWIGRPYWGQGIGTEALTMFLRYCSDALRLYRFEARVFEKNEASQRVLENNGFRRSRKMRLYVPKRGGWRRVFLYRLK